MTVAALILMAVFSFTPHSQNNFEGVLCKSNVNLRGLHKEMWLALPIIRKVYTNQIAILIITSGLDGKHKNNSLHYEGKAIDLRRWELENAWKAVLIMQRSLGKNYRVFLERTHIHVEYIGE